MKYSVKEVDVIGYWAVFSGDDVFVRVGFGSNGSKRAKHLADVLNAAEFRELPEPYRLKTCPYGVFEIYQGMRSVASFTPRLAGQSDVEADRDTVQHCVRTLNAETKRTPQCGILDVAERLEEDIPP